MSDSQTYKLFVGCQVTTVTEEQLLNCFSEIENVIEVKICKDNNNFCKGFAFITIFGGEASLKKALGMKASIEGRKLDITLAHGVELRNSTIRRQKEHKIFVKNLPLEINDKGLENLFIKYGQVKKAYVIYHYNTTISKRYGYVEFLDKECVDKAQKKTKFRLKGRDIIVSRYVPRSEQQDNVKYTKNQNVSDDFKGIEEPETTNSRSQSDSDSNMVKNCLQYLHEVDDFQINNFYNSINMSNQSEYDPQDQRLFNSEMNQFNCYNENSVWNNSPSLNQYPIESNPQEIYYNDTNTALEYQQPQIYDRNQINSNISPCQSQNYCYGTNQQQPEQINYESNCQNQNSQFVENYYFNTEMPQKQYANQFDSYYNCYPEQNQYYGEPVGSYMYSQDYAYIQTQDNYLPNNGYEIKHVPNNYI